MIQTAVCGIFEAAAAVFFYCFLLTSVVALTALSTSLAACGSGTTAQSGGSASSSGEQKVTLRLASVVSQNALDARQSGMAQGLMTWIDTVEEESGGSIEIQLYPDGQLATGTDAIVNDIQTGAFDVAHFVTGSWASYTDAFAELNVPYLYEDYDAVQKVLTSDIGESMKEKLQQDVPGIQPLAFISIGFRNVTVNRSVQLPKRQRSRKMRHIPKGFSAKELRKCISRQMRKWPGSGMP